jgi:5-methylcytosine-specific restriction endonuclease McrA
MPKDPRDSKKWRALRLIILARDGYTCHYCGLPANTVDHVVPVKSNPDLAMNLENCVAACRSCNSAKGSRSEGSFLHRGFTPPVFPDSSLSDTVRVVPDSPFVKPESMQVNAE